MKVFILFTKKGALIKAALHFGYEFIKRDAEKITVKIENEEFEYKVLAILPFNSTRKRMSVVLKNPDGEIVLYSKGADSIMLKLLANPIQYEKETIQCLKEMGDDGLRTLLCSKRIISPEEFNDWYKNEFVQAMNDTENREELVAEASAKLEVDMELIGKINHKTRNHWS
jgi:magnesium-transporting ATPase (P-type)